MKHKLQLASTEEREGWQGEYEEECRVWAKEHQPAITTLKAKLFAFAGDKLSPQPCYLVSEITENGQLISLPVKLRRIKEIRCHHNVALLWEQRKKRSKLKAIATGYALSEGGMWRPHSWGLTPTHIVETTVGRLRYFGLSMNAEDADIFAASFLIKAASEFSAKLEQLKLLRQPIEKRP